MAFGVKTKNIKTKNSYTIESFFDAIKDTPGCMWSGLSARGCGHTACG